MSLNKPLISSGNEKKDSPTRQTDLVLVLAPPFLTETPHLGLAYLSSYIRSHGFRVTVLDLNVELFNATSAHKKRLWDISIMNAYSSEQIFEELKSLFAEEVKLFIQRVIAKRALCIGFSVTTLNLCFSKFLAHQIQSMDPESLIVFGGPGVFVRPEKVDPENRIDMYVIGEGEKPLLEILQRCQVSQSRESLRDVPGTVLRKDTEYFKTLPPAPIHNLDDIGFPRFDEFDLSQYNSGHPSKMLSILFSRGCINGCRFCSDYRLNFPYRFRSAEKIFEELIHHKQRYGVTCFKINDLLCNGNLAELEKLCDLIIKHELRIEWSSYAVIREGMSPCLLAKMRKAGCIYLCYGLESAANPVLKRMKKKYTVQLAQEVLKNTCNANIVTAINIIVGFPGERPSDFRKTATFLKRNYRFIDEVTNISTYMFMPGTEISDDPYACGLRPPLTLTNIKRLISGKDLEMPLRSFYAIYGNTPKVRIKRLRYILKLVYSLGMINRIVNYLQDDAPDFDKDQEKIKCRNAKIAQNRMTEGTCLINTQWHIALKKKTKTIHVLAKQGKTPLFSSRKAMVITQYFGCNTSFCFEDHWIDSSYAMWHVSEEKEYLKISLEWSDYGFWQEWILSFDEQAIQWSVHSFQKQKNEISFLKAGIYISETYSHFIPAGEESVQLPPFTDDWQDINLKTLSPLSFVDKNRDNHLPRIGFNFNSNREAKAQVQTTPHALCARMVNLCYAPCEDQEKTPILTEENPLTFNLYIRKLSKTTSKKKR